MAPIDTSSSLRWNCQVILKIRNTENANFTNQILTVVVSRKAEPEAFIQLQILIGK